MATGIDPLAAAALLLLTAAMGVARRPRSAVALYAWLAVPQAAMLVALAPGAGPLLWADVVLLLAVKFVWVPSLLRRRLCSPDPEHTLRVAASPALLFSGAAVLVVLCVRLGLMLDPVQGMPLGLCAVAMLLGFGMPAVRRELWSQTAGILAGEGAVTCAVVLLVGEVAAAEGLMLAEALFLAAVLSALVHLVRCLHGSTDARLLEELRG